MSPAQNGSLAQRLFIGKSLGLLIGVLIFFVLPMIWSGAPLLLRWGILCWYTTLGGIVGLMGLLDRHPAFPGWKFPAWFRGIFIGGWMNFVLIFFAYDAMSQMLQNVNWEITSPWWFILAGAIVGLIIDLIATRYGGEGKAIL